jgi:thiamine biosynthesis lipoprotein
MALCSVAGIIGVLLIRNMDPLNTVSREGFAMDTTIRVTVSAAKSVSELTSIADGALRLAAGLEDKFSMHDTASDVSVISAGAGGELVEISKETYEVLAAALDVADMTDGAYDPTIGALTALWRLKLKAGAIPSEREIADALKKVGFGSLSLSSPQSAGLEEPGAMLDLGGIGKGYASEAVRRFLREMGVTSALVDMGGNIAVMGGSAKKGSGERKPWRVGIQHPTEPRGTPICVVSLSEGAVITAGDYERFQDVDGRRFTHIFDPGTGYPVDGSLKSVTVVSNEPTQADALSTAFMVMGPARSLELLRVIPGYEVVFVTESKDGEYGVAATSGLKGSIEPAQGGPRIVFHDIW